MEMETDKHPSSFISIAQPFYVQVGHAGKEDTLMLEWDEMNQRQRETTCQLEEELEKVFHEYRSKILEIPHTE